jgi:hypothetical protein
MFKKIVFFVVMISLLVGGVFSVPVVRAGTDIPAVLLGGFKYFMPGSYLKSFTISSSTIGLTPNSGVNYGYVESSVGGEWAGGFVENYTTKSLVIDGVSYVPAVIFHFTSSVHPWTSYDNVVIRYYNSVPLSSGNHTITWSLSGYVENWDGGHINVNWSGSYTGSINSLVTSSTYGPLSVTVAGDTSVGLGSTHSYTGTFVGGLPPFTTKWTITGIDSGISPVGTTSDRSESFNWKFGTSPGLVHFRCDVTDSNGSSAYGVLDVNLGSYAPSFMAQLYRISGETRFVMYPTVSDVPGSAVDPGTMNQVVNTKNYSVDFTVSGVTWSYYIDGDPLPLTNPLVVHVLYVDPSSGSQYSYTFTFDTSNIGDDGSWTKSNGTNGVGALPSWLQALKGMFFEGMKYLFIPTDQQMAQLLPGGSLGQSLLLDTAWGHGDTTWKYTAHWTVSGQVLDVVLVDVDFSKLGSFASTVRLIVQAGMSISLIYLVVVLI